MDSKKKTGFEKAESRMKKFWTISIALHNVRSIKGKCMGVYTCKTQDSSVGKATRYGLDGQGIESRWGARFSAPVQTGPGAHPASYTMGTWSFPRGKAAGAWS